MERMHFTHNYLLDPRHPVTVILIGAGGTGSQALTLLARMNSALMGLGHPGLFVKVYDPDIVSGGKCSSRPMWGLPRPTVWSAA